MKPNKSWSGKSTFISSEETLRPHRRILEENLQLKTFVKIIVKEMIADNKYKEAKRLFNEYIQSKDTNNSFNGYHSCWDEYCWK
jgi:hypothetical protein